MAISRKGRLTFVHDNSQSCEHVQRYVILSGARSAQSRPRRERNVIIVHGRKTLSAGDLSAEFGLSSSLRSKRRYNPRGRTHSSALSFTKRWRSGDIPERITVALYTNIQNPRPRKILRRTRLSSRAKSRDLAGANTNVAECYTLYAREAR